MGLRLRDYDLDLRAAVCLPLYWKSHALTVALQERLPARARAREDDAGAQSLHGVVNRCLQPLVISRERRHCRPSRAKR